MNTRSRRSFVPRSWATCSFGVALLAGACLAPEFTKVDQAGTGGWGGVGGTTMGSTLTTSTGGNAGGSDTGGSGAGGSEAGGSDAGGSGAGGTGGDGATNSSTTQSTNAGGASGGTEAGSGGSNTTDGGAGGNGTGGSATTSTSTGGTTTSCGEGLEECSGECVSLDDDNEHCGECGTACAALEQCSGGECECVEDYTECASGCVQTSSNGQHCGSCGNECEPGEVCSNGSCSADCGAELTECEAGCVNTDTSLEHCGGCNSACDPGFECSGGSCVCGSGLTECDGTCVDTESSGQHCNGCNMPCASGESCNGGSCECSGGTDRCNGQCIDTDTNNSHCGACDTPCDTRCEAGTCVDIPGYWTEGPLLGCSWIAVDNLGTTAAPLDFTDPGAELYCVEGDLYPDYSAFAMVGFNIAEPPVMDHCGLFSPDANPPAADIEALGTGIAVRVDASANGTFRLQLLGPNGATDENERWCAAILAPDASGRVFVPFSAFSTECWEGGDGNPYSGSDIVSVAFLVPGTNHAEPYSFCVHGWAVGTSIADAP